MTKSLFHILSLTLSDLLVFRKDVLLTLSCSMMTSSFRQENKQRLALTLRPFLTISLYLSFVFLQTAALSAGSEARIISLFLSTCAVSRRCSHGTCARASSSQTPHRMRLKLASPLSKASGVLATN